MLLRLQSPPNMRHTIYTNYSIFSHKHKGVSSEECPPPLWGGGAVCIVDSNFTDLENSCECKLTMIIATFEILTLHGLPALIILRDVQ